MIVVAPIDTDLVHAAAGIISPLEWNDSSYHRLEHPFRRGRTITYRKMLADQMEIPGEISACVDEIIRVYPDCTVLRIEISYLGPNTTVDTHIDGREFHSLCHRVHIPLITDHLAWITIDGEDFHLPIGNIYEINNKVPHSVRNDSSSPRMHMIVDVIPPENYAVTHAWVQTVIDK